MGISGIGRHVLSTRRMAMAAAIPHTPPATETTSASVNIWRRISRRPDPSAMRTAISRALSAARAEKRVPRLAQAASRMRRCEQREPSHEGACRPAKCVSGEPGMRQRKLQAVIRLGIRFGERVGNRIQVRRRCLRRDTWLQMADDPRRVIAALIQKIRIAQLRQIDDRYPEDPAQRKARCRGSRPARRQ